MSTNPKRRWFRFSLRAILVLVAVVSVPLAWVGYNLHRVRQQRAIARAVLELGGDVYFDFQVNKDNAIELPMAPPPGPEWQRKLFGDDQS